MYAGQIGSWPPQRGELEAGRYLTVVRVTDFEEETENARQLMEKYPLQGLFGGVTMDHSGRVVARNFNYGRKPDAMVREQKERFEAEVAPAFDRCHGRSTAAEARIT